MRTYTRGQLVLLADASRYLADPDLSTRDGAAPIAAEKDPDAELRAWIETADTTKMTLREYKKFLKLQYELNARTAARRTHPPTDGPE